MAREFILKAYVKVSGRKILLGAIKSNALMLQNWEKVHGRWDTGLRYEMMRLERGDYEELFDAYRGLITWIRLKLVES